MHVRVVRFTDVDAEHLEGRLAEISQGEGPPEGVPATGIKFLFDADQRTAVVLQYFDSAEDMATGAATLDAMDPSDTPGTRASVDACELKMEMGAG
jgi:hypothetical protein